MRRGESLGRRGGAARAAGGASRLATIPAGPPPGSPLEWAEDVFVGEIVIYIRGHKKRRIEGLDQRLQRLYPGVRGMRMLCHHETDSRKTAAGWPDLFIAGPGGQLSAECKTEIRRRRVTAEQGLWLDVLGLNGFPAFVWTPADLGRRRHPERTRTARPADRGSGRGRAPTGPAPAVRVRMPEGRPALL